MTYRIKRLHNEPGWDAVPIDPRISQWNSMRDAKTDGLHIEAKAYPPKVTIRNDIFPRTYEVYNCTTCLNGEPEHPAHKTNMEKFRVKCKGNMQWNEGPRTGDIGCPNWDRRIPRPSKGYLEGIER